MTASSTGRTGTPDRPLSVLVVDDLPDAAESVAEVLSLYGFSTRVACGGSPALELAAADPPDVVLLDLLMPGMDGWELARRLKAQARVKRPLLVAVSGCGGDADRRRSAESGIDLHLVKPADPAALVGLLRRFERVAGRPAGAWA
ncbi:MAG TPA: response regulator [Urbifossiella sp.]|jgi:CheY-like chemotaxis protein|nr:response regulator [Urbifossiella sp.]